MKQPDSPDAPTRRALLQGGIGAGALLVTGLPAFAAAPPGFDAWRDSFRSRALAKGISDATWTRVMGRIEPDMSVFRQMQKQPEFHEQIWQYVQIAAGLGTKLASSKDSTVTDAVSKLTGEAADLANGK